MAGYSTPEILQADLAALALQLARWGMKPDEMTWLDQPPSAPFAQARDLLKRLGALDDLGSSHHTDVDERATSASTDRSSAHQRQRDGAG